MSEMKLSEAIRLGAMDGPQAYWRAYDPATGGTCAQGAAALAIGCLDKETGQYIVPFPKDRVVGWRDVYLEFMERPCPVCGLYEEDYKSNGLMAHLNNEHRWTREQIADAVEEIERRADAERQPEPETVATAARLVPQE